MRGVRRTARRICDGPTLLRAFRSAVANLEAHVEEVNALNVFPVPDGDTGSNMLATVRAALTEAEAVPPHLRTLDRVAEALSYGALMGARGNSGLILSQVLRGMAEAAAGRHHADGADLGEALRRGAETAYAAVLKPVEGTILTVVREAAEAAIEAGERDHNVETVLVHAVGGAERSVANTPELLPILREAGVIDSGGHGLYLLLRGLLLDIADVEILESEADPGASLALVAHTAHATHRDGDYGYETMFVIQSQGTPLDLAAMRRDLGVMGESIALAGDERQAKIHVHNRRPDEVLAYGLAHGRLVAISVENLDAKAAGEPSERTPEHGAWEASGNLLDVRPLRGTRDLADARATHGVPESTGAAQARTTPNGTRQGSSGPTSHPPTTQATSRVPTDLAVVVVCAGDGLARAFRSIGVAEIVRGGQRANPSTGELAAAIRRTNARQVLLLPNNPNVRLTAEHAGRLVPDAHVTVVDTRNAAEGIAAVLAMDPRATAEANARPMLEAARRIQSIQVTEAVRDAVIAGRHVRRGQTIALDPDEGLLAAGDERVAVTLEGIARLRAGSELVTIYWGDGATESEAAELAGGVRGAMCGAEVEIIHGGQPHYAYLIAAE